MDCRVSAVVSGGHDAARPGPKAQEVIPFAQQRVQHNNVMSALLSPVLRHVQPELPVLLLLRACLDDPRPVNRRRPDHERWAGDEAEHLPSEVRSETRGAKTGPGAGACRGPGPDRGQSEAQGGERRQQPAA